VDQTIAAFTPEQQQKRRMRFLLIVGGFMSCIIPMFAAGVLGRDKNFAVMWVSAIMFGGLIGGIGLIATFYSDAEWRKEFRVLARAMLFAGIPFLFCFNLLILSAIVPVARNLNPVMGYKVGEYPVVERDGRLDVLVSGARYNLTDRVMMIMPGAIPFRDLHSVVDGKDIRVTVQAEHSFKKPTPTLVLPVDEQNLLMLYKRTLGQPLEEVMAKQVGELAVRYLESLPAEERMEVKKLTLVWDVPVNSAFHGIGASLEGSNQLTLLVKVSSKPAEAPVPIQIQNHDTIERIVPVSTLGI
jgi:hypothetical protein